MMKCTHLLRLGAFFAFVVQWVQKTKKRCAVCIFFRLTGVMFLCIGLRPFEIPAEIPNNRLGEGVYHGDDPLFMFRGRLHAASLLFADLILFSYRIVDF